MVNQAEEPLTKVTLNLFEADVEYIKQRIPDGWTKFIRDLVRTAVDNHKGDLDD